MDERPQALTLQGEQSMLLWAGVPLIAVLSEVSKHGIYNSQFLTVVGYDDGSLELECAEGGARYTVCHTWARSNLRLGYAVCYASIQSRTWHKSCALWDTAHPMFTRRHLVMGLSRATRLVDVWRAD